MNFLNLFLADTNRLPGWVTASFPIIRMVIMILMVIASLCIVVCVLMQKSNSDGLGAISGGSDTFFGQNKSKTLEGRLKKWTVILSVAMVAMSVLYFITVIVFPNTGV